LHTHPSLGMHHPSEDLRKELGRLEWLNEKRRVAHDNEGEVVSQPLIGTMLLDHIVVSNFGRLAGRLLESSWHAI
jgi:hypothetical protein